MEIFSILRKIRLGVGIFNMVAYAKLTNKIMPIIVALQITKKCNLRCIHCYSSLDSVKDIKEFSSREIFDLVDKLFRLGTRKIQLLGGEPLLRDDLGEIIDYIKAKGIICEMYSNGYLIKKRIDIIKKIDFLHISIDGDREINDKIRGHGSYDKILECLEFLTTLKKCRPKLNLHFVANRLNLYTLEHVANLAKKYRIMLTVNEYGAPAGKILLELKLNAKDYEELYRQIKNLKKIGYPVVYSKLALKYLLDYWPSPDKATLYKKDIENLNCNTHLVCQYGRRYFFVDVDAHIYSCPLRWKQGISFRDVGIDKAIEYVSNRDCVICRELGFTGTSGILDFKLQNLLWSIQNYF